METPTCRSFKNYDILHLLPNLNNVYTSNKEMAIYFLVPLRKRTSTWAMSTSFLQKFPSEGFGHNGKTQQNGIF